MQLLSREGHTVSHNSKRHYHDAFVAMSRMRQRGLLCDIVLHVAAKEIRAHKVVLASCSPYFHAMFTSKYCPIHPVHWGWGPGALQTSQGGTGLTRCPHR